VKLSVIIPVYNEVGTVAEIVRRVQACALPAGLERELVIIDDGSTDGTASVLAELQRAEPQQVCVRTHRTNMGKGAAVRTALPLCQGDFVLIQDADLEYDPADYLRLLAPLLDGRADVVFGSRFVGGDSHRVLYFWHAVANRGLTLLSNMLTNLNLTDMEVCFKVFTRQTAQRLVLEEDRFGIEPELTAKVARLKCRIYEVGISYSGRTYAEGKKITWRDGTHALWCILKYNLLR